MMSKSKGKGKGKSSFASGPYGPPPMKARIAKSMVRNGGGGVRAEDLKDGYCRIVKVNV